jgi:predicted dehydrogenase
VARDLVAAGAEVPCFLVTSERSLASGRDELERHTGASSRGYIDVERMLDAEALDALAILSPAETHLEYLWRAVRHGLAVLCEKPLIWGVPHLRSAAAEVVGNFIDRGILLYENCQWPFTLPGFAQLYPGALDAPPRIFRMELQPASRGVQALGDSLSHPLSLLQALLPGQAPEISEIWFSRRGGPTRESPLTIRFHYESSGHACDAEVLLRDDDVHPRRAAISLDGREARRVVTPETYQLSFAASHRSVPLDDPLTTLVADFVGRLRAPDRADLEARARDIEQRMRLLAELAHAFVHEETM